MTQCEDHEARDEVLQRREADLMQGNTEDPADAMARIFVWLRYSSSRQLTWQRNYNTQPRILGSAQERLTHKMAEVAPPASRCLFFNPALHCGRFCGHLLVAQQLRQCVNSCICNNLHMFQGCVVQTAGADAAFPAHQLSGTVGRYHYSTYSDLHSLEIAHHCRLQNLHSNSLCVMVNKNYSDCR